jgi:hypothetical protein
MRLQSRRDVSDCRTSDGTGETWRESTVPASCRESLTLIVRVLARQAARETVLATDRENEDAPSEE